MVARSAANHTAAGVPLGRCHHMKHNSTRAAQQVGAVEACAVAGHGHHSEQELFSAWNRGVLQCLDASYVAKKLSIATGFCSLQALIETS